MLEMLRSAPEQPAAPRIAQGKPYAPARIHRHSAVVILHRPPAEHSLELVDAGTVGCGFIAEHASPVVAVHAGSLEAQHVLPMQPAIGASDEGAIAAVFSSEPRGGVYEAGGRADANVGMPDELLATPGRVAEGQPMRGRCAAKPVTVGQPNAPLPGEFVVEPSELLEPIKRLRDQFVVQVIPAIGTADLTATGGIKGRLNLIHRAREIGAQRLEGHRARPWDRTRTIAMNQDV